jgi:hypothetical protein
MSGSARDDGGDNVVTRLPRRPMTPRERKERWKERKRLSREAAQGIGTASGTVQTVPPTPASLLPDQGTPVPANAIVAGNVTPLRRPIARIVLTIAAGALATVGITINGSFARSLGSTETAGYLFLAIGVATDCVALVLPSCAGRLWQARQRATAAAGWAIWVVTFVFAVMAGIGFGSTNIADVRLARASRTTPAVQLAQAALADAMLARDRECANGVGANCRRREVTVNDRRQVLDNATHAIEQSVDPQTDAAMRIVAWASLGTVRPTENDFAMLRLMLLALLPQIGGVLLMIARTK